MREEELRISAATSAIKRKAAEIAEIVKQGGYNLFISRFAGCFDKPVAAAGRPSLLVASHFGISDLKADSTEVE